MATGDVREIAHLFQRLSVAVQHFNCVLFGCFFIVLLFIMMRTIGPI